ncbi:hypothetical protein TorRG33x02_073400 [Trema orientale]|uniref:Uncharacterized protein n=1 Tax=Trema orientale TaxID=63057 RepID=A0A2P5FGP1_TREOI|nr:hypothetical protein TorRG33x02_073400 [Trema orientale]
MGASRGAPLLFLRASRSTACLGNSEAENTESNGCSNKRTENALVVVGITSSRPKIGTHSLWQM